MSEFLDKFNNTYGLEAKVRLVEEESESRAMADTERYVLVPGLQPIISHITNEPYDCKLFWFVAVPGLTKTETGKPARNAAFVVPDEETGLDFITLLNKVRSDRVLEKFGGSWTGKIGSVKSDQPNQEQPCTTSEPPLIAG